VPTLLDKPVTSLDRLFANNVPCRAQYGAQRCGNKAKWKIIMSCCGFSDFLCDDCLANAQNTDKKLPSWNDYIGCEGCAKLHPTWTSAVKEIVSI
jgi:hypothetical protein